MVKKGSDDGWSGAFKAIGIRSLTTGRFWQFCFLLVLLVLVWRIESADWVKISELFLKSYVYSGLGWVLWGITVVVALLLHRSMRARYLAEIERVSEERNKAQAAHLPQSKASKYKKK